MNAKPIKIKEDDDLSSTGNRLLDFLSKMPNDEKKWSFYKNPHNVKMVAEIVMETNKSPFLAMIYQDILDKSNQAIKDNRLMGKEESFALMPFMIDNDVRKTLIKDFLEDENMTEIPPKSIFKVLRSKKMEVKNSLLEPVVLSRLKWNTLLPVGKEQRYLILCALQNTAPKVADALLPAITKEEFLNEIKDVPVFNGRGENLYDGNFNGKNFASFMITYGDFKFVNKMIDQFSDCLTKEIKFMLIQKGSQNIIDGCIKAEGEFNKKGKFSITNVSQDEYDYVSRLKSIVTKSEYKEYLNTNMGYQRHQKDFFKEIDKYTFIKDRFGADGETVKPLQNKMKP